MIHINLTGLVLIFYLRIDKIKLLHQYKRCTIVDI